MRELLNVLRGQAQMASQGRAATRLGLVTSFDPATYSAKVALQPGGQETGWLPVGSAWTGNGWGLFAPPSPGDMVEVQFQEGGLDAGLIGQRFFSDADRPLPCPAGEFWLAHASGSTLRFLADGTVQVSAAADMQLTSATRIDATAPAIALNGVIALNGPITQTNTAAGSGAQMAGPLVVVGDVTAGGVSLEHHTHGGVRSGSEQSGEPST